MADEIDPKLKVFELYLATAEKVSDRRAAANAWMLSVNSAIVALYGYLAADKLSVPLPQKGVWLWAIPAAGAIVSVAWAVLLTSYRQLNRAKFGVLQDMEKDLPSQPFAKERERYGTAATALQDRDGDPALLPAALCRHHCRGGTAAWVRDKPGLQLLILVGKRGCSTSTTAERISMRSVNPLSTQRGCAEETSLARRPQATQGTIVTTAAARIASSQRFRLSPH